MKGVIFVALADMFQTKLGHSFWNGTINDSNLESQGIYTAAENYKDTEATLLIQTLEKKLNKSPETLFHLFGNYLIKYFKRRYPLYFKAPTYFDFLQSVDEIIHFEYKKINHDAYPPKIIVAPKSTENLIFVSYSSERKLCTLAQGLLEGAAEIYNENVNVKHAKCINDGHSCCEFVITKN